MNELTNAPHPKKLLHIKQHNGTHWVGDGFPVRNSFGYYDDIVDQLSPFVLMDFAGPTEFTPTDKRRGVGEHPHRGFETVSIIYSGQVAHRDSSGGGGVIGPGEVQWMTAASGVVHEEFHGEEYARTGGPFEMIQLWVNLPKKFKMTTPGYQGITKDLIPIHTPTDPALGHLRVIAGKLENANWTGPSTGGTPPKPSGTLNQLNLPLIGPAKTYSPMNVWDGALQKGATLSLDLPAGWTTAVFVLEGEISVPGQLVPHHSGTSQIGREAELLIFETGETGITNAPQQHSTLQFSALSGGRSGAARFLILNGEPFREPIVGHGPFVMNSEEEIRQAYADFRAGRMGQLISNRLPT